MFLSKLAKFLLDEKMYSELASLPLNELLDDESLKKFNEDRTTQSLPENSSNATQAVTTDIISREDLIDPVVIESGHIFSRETIKQWFKSLSLNQSQSTPQPAQRLYDSLEVANECRCPITNQLISQDVIISLPQLTYAIAKLKFEMRLRFATIRHAELTIDVSANKIRFSIEGYAAPLYDCFRYFFHGKDNQIGTGNYTSYSASPWSFAWLAVGNSSRIELWLPQEQVSDAMINELIADALKPLDLQTEDDQAPFPVISVKELKPRTYVSVVEKLAMQSTQVSSCCLAFIKACSELRARMVPGVEFDDKIERHSTQPAPRQHLGKRLIGTTFAESSQSTHRQRTETTMTSAMPSMSQSQQQ